MRIDEGFDPLGAAHPRFRPNRFQPVRETRDEPEVLPHMLLSDPTGRNDPAGGERDRRAKDCLREPDPSRMMKHRAVTKVCTVGF